MAARQRCRPRQRHVPRTRRAAPDRISAGIRQTPRDRAADRTQPAVFVRAAEDEESQLDMCAGDGAGDRFGGVPLGPSRRGYGAGVCSTSVPPLSAAMSGSRCRSGASPARPRAFRISGRRPHQAIAHADGRALRPRGSSSPSPRSGTSRPPAVRSRSPRALTHSRSQRTTVQELPATRRGRNAPSPRQVRAAVPPRCRSPRRARGALLPGVFHPARRARPAEPSHANGDEPAAPERDPRRRPTLLRRAAPRAPGRRSSATGRRRRTPFSPAGHRRPRPLPPGGQTHHESPGHRRARV